MLENATAHEKNRARLRARARLRVRGETEYRPYSFGTVFSIGADGSNNTLLHSFGYAADGAYPTGSLALSDGKLYGMTSVGGMWGGGTIFSIGIHGSNYTVLRDFEPSSSTDGSAPYGDLILSGSTMYGMTRAGGASDAGTIFSIGTDGTGFTLLHSFHLTSLSNGSKPLGSLILSGSTLYGTTNYGGSVDGGTIFSISTSGTGFSVLHSFDAAPTNGKYPENSLILSGGYLYGATIGGGANGHGTIFRIGSDGSGFTLLHSFDGNSLSNGKSPRGSLLLLGSTLYGTTISAGPNGYGTIFSIATSGASFTVLHGFRKKIASDGETPLGSLILCGSALCGMTSVGGASNLGTIFSIGTDGSGFSLVHSFDGSTSSEGTWPVGNLTPNASGTKLYGMTTLGGANRVGTIFRIDIDGRNLTRLHSFDSSVASNAGQPQGSLLLSGSTLYGMTLDGGEQGSGAIFSIETDGSGFTLIHSFSAEIGSPLGSLIISGGTLYGMTASNIFSVGTSGSNFTDLHAFTGGSTDGLAPKGNLTLSGTTLFGMTTTGGTNNEGTIFSIGTDGSGFALLHSFADNSATNGRTPEGSLILVGSTLYGMTERGGTNDYGTIFSIGTDGSGFAVRHSFDNASALNGSRPYGDLALFGTKLYGMTIVGGAHAAGALFSIGTTGWDFSLLHSFKGSSSANGSHPRDSLVLVGKSFYGMTKNGGANAEGTIFSYGELY